MGGLAQKALGIEGADITFVRPPMAPAYNGDQSVLVMEPEGTAELLNTYFRPEGQEKSVQEINLYTLPMDLGVAEASVRTMTDIQSVEAESPDGAAA